MTQNYKHLPNLNIYVSYSKEISPKFRYRLVATLQNTKHTPKTVCAIMQNPSYANQTRSDKSISVLEKVVFEKQSQYPEFKNVTRLIVVNLFAYIQTNDFIGSDDEVGCENDIIIKQSLDEADIILLAWGSSNNFTQRKNTVWKMILEFPKDGKKLLQTSRHPSRVIYNDFIKEINL
jgi:hypothetical protein